MQLATVHVRVPDVRAAPERRIPHRKAAACVLEQARFIRVGATRHVHHIVAASQRACTTSGHPYLRSHSTFRTTGHASNKKACCMWKTFSPSKSDAQLSTSKLSSTSAGLA